jgi:hypothetical protein
MPSSLGARKRVASQRISEHRRRHPRNRQEPPCAILRACRGVEAGFDKLSLNTKHRSRLQVNDASQSSQARTRDNGVIAETMYMKEQGP